MSIVFSGIDGLNQGSVTLSTSLPVGTTAQRPVSPESGMLRFNSNTSVTEFYDSNTWISLGSK
jgi:hypothetical protein